MTTATAFTNTGYSEGLHREKNRQDFVVGVMKVIAEVSNSDLIHPEKLRIISNFEVILNQFCKQQGMTS